LHLPNACSRNGAAWYDLTETLASLATDLPAAGDRAVRQQRPQLSPGATGMFDARFAAAYWVDQHYFDGQYGRETGTMIQ
jgi:hypothetical protein